MACMNRMHELLARRDDLDTDVIIRLDNAPGGYHVTRLTPRHMQKCTRIGPFGTKASNGGCSQMNDRSDGGLSARSMRPAELAVLASICREAAECHGDDWPAVERHMKQRLDALPSDQRQRLAHEMDRVLRYRAPDRGMQTQ